MGLVSAAAVLALARPDLVTLEERTAEELCEVVELLLTALLLVEELERVALEDPLLEERVAVPEEELLLERTAVPLLEELERVALEVLLLEERVALPEELLAEELLRVSCVEVELLLEGVLLELERVELLLTEEEERVALEPDDEDELERVALLEEELLLERVELDDELEEERVAEPLLVLVCAAIWGAVSKAIAIKNEAA